MPGSIVGISGKSDDPEMFIGLQSFLQPTTVLRYDFMTGELTPFHQPALTFDASQFEVRQISIRRQMGRVCRCFSCIAKI